MMKDISAAKCAAAARLSPIGSPEYYLACQICLLEGKNPDAFAQLFGEGAPLITNWQAVIARQVLEALLRLQLRNGPSLGNIGATPMIFD
jgi:hypothetical protein